MRWDAFVQACPEIGVPATARFENDQVLIVATLRRDGFPRISPCEPDIVAGHLMIGMMWRSQKVLDLERDTRVSVHSKVPDREGSEGDIKCYGRAVAIDDPGLRRAYREAIMRRIDWAPEEPHFHLFSIDVTSAASMRFGDDPTVITWDAVRGTRTLPFAPP